MKSLFMGTPDFVAKALVSLSKCTDVVGVVTQGDKPRGRGYTLTPPPVKVCAENLGLSVYQPDKIRGDEFAALLSELSPELILVAAYGKILPENVLSFPIYGCVNIHASLLPKYRGAAPIQRAIMNGERETGVTFMYMDAGLDTGDMIFSRRVPIEDADDFGTIHDKLAQAGADGVYELVSGLESGTLTRTPQPRDGATYAAKIENADMALDFSKSADEVSQKIRALSPMPLAYTHTKNGKLLKIISCAVAEGSENNGNGENNGAGKAGEVLSLSGGRVRVKCGMGSIEILSCQPEGGRRMTAADLINGRRVALGDILSNEFVKSET
ncbi:MAG: methionyl-tRNA formyltransferase [Clostridia bacterium]|nr:methionyl-tRNA formyltransferase [Clostridia bacterium]